MIASDLHGSGYYCEKLLQAFDRLEVMELTANSILESQSLR